MTTPAVLLLAFNRPDLTRRVFEAIRQAKPPIFFFAVDGPRTSKPSEIELNREIRSLADEVDWPCEVKTRFNEENLGCKRAVTGAIDWFFEHVEEGIILEDDCLPHPSFFPYCAEMLERYRYDERVGMVSGDNFRPQLEWRDSGHEFSLFTFIWGWATWRRAWRYFDGEMTDWPELRRSGWLKRVFCRSEAVLYWTKVLERCYRGQVDTWDYPWSYSCWKAGFLSVVPACNLISNIGFDERGTHTVDQGNPKAGLPVQEIHAPWDATSEPMRDCRQEKRYLRSVYGIHFLGWRKRASRALRSLRSSISHGLSWWTLPLAGCRARVRRHVNLLKQEKRFQPGRAFLDDLEWSYPDAVSFAYAYEQIFLRRIYDFRFSNETPTIVDCGSNVGLAVIYWKKQFPKARITAVEADPSICAYLKENLKTAGIGDVQVLNRAVSSSAGSLVFLPQGADGGCLVESVEKPPAGSILVPAVSLDVVLGEAHVDFLKLDIEGAECDVLIDREDALARTDRVFVEYHSYVGRVQRLDELLGTLRRAGFRIQIHHELISRNPFLEIPDDGGMDFRANIYAWREKS